MGKAGPAALLGAVLLLAGCGQADDRAAVRSATERFFDAYAAKQGEAACGLLSSDTRKALEGEESRPCPEAIGSVELSGGAVMRVQVNVTNAKVDLVGGESVFLSEQTSGWRIAAVGCRASKNPTETPFDCQLEA